MHEQAQFADARCWSSLAAYSIGLMSLVRYLLFGTGDVAPVAHEVLRSGRTGPALMN
ncbi:MAG: hypothetical protein JOZ81_31075 [Chloroflexi bacterium]|nr:hypothetical protein [Chloroflexota bacterium]